MSVARLSEVSARYTGPTGSLSGLDISGGPSPTSFGLALGRAVNDRLPSSIRVYKLSGGSATFNPDSDHALATALTLHSFADVSAIRSAFPSTLEVSGIPLQLAGFNLVRPGPVPGFTVENFVTWTGIGTSVSAPGDLLEKRQLLDLAFDRDDEVQAAKREILGLEPMDSTTEETVEDTDSDPTAPGGSSTSDPEQLTDAELEGMVSDQGGQIPPGGFLDPDELLANGETTTDQEADTMATTDTTSSLLLLALVGGLVWFMASRSD